MCIVNIMFNRIKFIIKSSGFIEISVFQVRLSLHICFIINKINSMKTVFKTTILIAFLSLVIMYSNTIQKELIERYHNGISFLSSHTISKANIAGF